MSEAINHNLLDIDSLSWAHYREAADYPYPVSYWGHILNIDSTGHVSALYRWDPGGYCHFHRHVCETTSVVLQGELRIQTFENGEPVTSGIRRVGDYAKKPPNDVHMEQGGPEGALLLFELYAPDGQLTQQLDADGNVLRTLTTKDLQRALARQQTQAAA